MRTTLEISRIIHRVTYRRPYRAALCVCVLPRPCTIYRRARVWARPKKEITARGIARGAAHRPAIVFAEGNATSEQCGGGARAR